MNRLIAAVALTGLLTGCGTSYQAVGEQQEECLLVLQEARTAGLEQQNAIIDLQEEALKLERRERVPDEEVLDHWERAATVRLGHVQDNRDLSERMLTTCEGIMVFDTDALDTERDLQDAIEKAMLDQLTVVDELRAELGMSE